MNLDMFEGTWGFLPCEKSVKKNPGMDQHLGQRKQHV